MGPASGRQWLLSLEKIYDRFQFVDVFALFVDAPQIPLKSGRRAKFQRHQTRSRSSLNEL